MGASAAVLAHVATRAAPEPAAHGEVTPGPPAPSPEPAAVATRPPAPPPEVKPEEPEAEEVVEVAVAPTPRPVRRPRTPEPARARAADPAPAIPAPAPATARPSRAAVRDAFLRVHDGVQACGEIELVGTTVVARVIFDATTGRARFAQVTDARVPPEVRSCVARVARDAQVEPFAGADLTVVYPFRL